MIRFPNCKINLGLSILEKLPDGYHRIETLYYPVPLKDILEIIPSGKEQTTLSLTGIKIDGQAEQNLCFKAWKLLHEKYGVSAVDIYLHKIIPAGAGLGGGSSDAASALLMMNEIFSLGISANELSMMASKLGMDCPFFLLNSPAIGSHKGEILESMHIDLKGKYLVLVKPDIHISTAEAYAGVIPGLPEHKLTDILQLPVHQWRGLLLNDFEDSIFRLYPGIGRIKETFYHQGALYASMSGSGSSVFGIFDREMDLAGMFGAEFYWSGWL
jgi:4-diphosphocytidyl-2-C-methyl-D-erythritol kinase